MKDKETVGLNYEYEYERLQTEMNERLEKEKNTKNIIIEKLQEEIEFYKNIIKSILNIK